MIDGVKVKQLKTNLDSRGRLFEVLRSDDKLFMEFGQAYITTVFTGVVKAWHRHEYQTDNMCLVSGDLKLVIYDSREDSPTRGQIDEFCLGPDNRLLVQIPPQVYHGFQNIGSEEAIVLNLPDRVYDHKTPDEQRLDPHDNEIPYDWRRRDG
ncbi:MAG: dTDP-4-dehydrorhamnose 3,5-epimerase family protein [bacterium]